MDQLVLFDYETLDTETRIVVRQRAVEIKDLMSSTAENIMRVGEKLLEVQVKLGNGKFDAWLQAEFDWSRRTAYNFIGVFKEFRGRANFAQIDIATSALYLLSAPSTPESAKQEIIMRAEAGEPISHTTAKAVVEAHRTAEAEITPKQQGLPTAPADEAESEWLDETEEKPAPPSPVTRSSTPVYDGLRGLEEPATQEMESAAPAPPPPPPPAPKPQAIPDYHLHVTLKSTGLCLVTLTQVGKADPLANLAVHAESLMAEVGKTLLTHVGIFGEVA
jgi:hypothetical protein